VPQTDHPTGEIASDPHGILQPFDYAGVRLGAGRLRDQFERTRDYYLGIPDDDLLKGFRERAGRPAPGQDLGGWYSGDDRGLWYSRGDTFHNFGHWLSAFARMARATGEAALHDKALHLMTEWSRTIAPDGYCFFSDHPNAPHYTYDKLCGGLVDIATYLNNGEALSHLARITHWARHNLDRVRVPASYDDFIGGGPLQQSEWYTLSEHLYRAFRLTGERTYRDFAAVWHYGTFWDALARGEDAFVGKHAYSHVHSLASAAMAFAVTEQPGCFAAIANGYAMLADHHLFFTGGYGPAERFQPADGSMGRSLESLDWEVPDLSAETTCGSWAGFKLGRYLMGFTGQAHYGDWIERLVYNAIGAALPMAGRGRTFYHSSYMLRGACKRYYPELWPCCSGTYPLAVNDYHNLIYFRDAGGIYVNLYVPSELTWQQDGVDARLMQTTAFPERNDCDILVHTPAPLQFALRFRAPGWARQSITLSVNGQPVAATTARGWLEIERVWHAGDTVRIELPMRLAFVPVDAQHPQRVALTYGPVVLVADRGPALRGDLADPVTWIIPGDASLTFHTTGRSSRATFRPFYALGEDERYWMYLDVSG
jgi:uncharacterized protein